MYFDSRDTTEFYQRAYFLTRHAQPEQLGAAARPQHLVGGFGQLSYQLTDA
jgi:iron complex outermembrane receptor protein